MSQIREAVILAAGMGSRIQNFWAEKPKGLLKIGKKTLIEESIERLVGSGISHIILVTGYQHALYEELLADVPCVTLVYNQHYQTRGSMYSLFLARDFVHGDFLLLESDLIYETQCLTLLLASPHKNCLLLSGIRNIDDEVHVCGFEQHMNNLSKNPQEIKNPVGVFVGISKFSIGFFNELSTLAESRFKNMPKYEYEDCLVNASKHSPIHFLCKENLLWMEIDDRNHFHIAQQKYPLICQSDIDTPLFKNVSRKTLLNPGPATTTDTVKMALVTEDICPREDAFGHLLSDIQTRLKDVIHGGEAHETILFASSGTGAVEACLSSVIPEGKCVLVLNNGAYGKRMVQICDGFGIKHIDWQLPWNAAYDLDALETLIQKHTDALSHIAMVHHETTSGILNPLDEVSRLAAKYDKELIVDAMSSFAGTLIDVRKCPIHYLISSANKCLQGMAGMSFVICERTSLLKTSSFKRRNFYFNLYDNFLFFSKTKQMRFTPPVQVIYALHQALNELFLETVNGRSQRYLQLSKVMKKGLADLGFRFLIEEENHSPILISVLEPRDPRFDFSEMHDHLYSLGFTIYPGKIDTFKTFRLANIGAICEQDIQHFLDALSTYLNAKNIIVP